MFNYKNLNDVEFEELCKDVMSSLLKTELRSFARGRDGGIDLTDNVSTKNIIVQVKQYQNSKFSNLKSSLKKEVDKIKKFKPKQYYICCGLELTASNINELYQIFSSFMDSDKNIFTIKEIDDFLQKEENSYIVSKHYKLWLYSSNILQNIFNQDIFIDCEVLLNDIETECNYFVQTQVFYNCLNKLQEHNSIMLIGSPGFGKTITSKILILYYSNLGYTVRFSSSDNISDIKKALSRDREKKEIVLLDDCLGQHYFNMKEKQGNELISLICYIQMNKNKCLILNSRVTIFNEAKTQYEVFRKTIENKKLKTYVIDMEKIDIIEKAKIFYNHLVQKKLPIEYFEAIRFKKRYNKIISHKNYTPRIIDYITSPNILEKIAANSYFDFIIEKLEYPEDIWRDEYCQRLKLIDRIFLNTLYSLSDLPIDIDILKRCFNKRLLSERTVDSTLDNFKIVLKRLNCSIILIFDNKGKKQVGVINPSVNDFLKNYLKNNENEINQIISAAIFYVQIERILFARNINQMVNILFLSGAILDIEFENIYVKNHFMVSWVCSNIICDIKYNQLLQNFLLFKFGSGNLNKDCLSFSEIMNVLLSEPFYDFYGLKLIFESKVNINIILNNLALNDIVDVINILYLYFEKMNYNKYLHEIYSLNIKNSILRYIADIDLFDYYNVYDFTDIARQDNAVINISLDEITTDTDVVSDTICQFVEQDIEGEINDILLKLHANICFSESISNLISIDFGEINDTVCSFFENDYTDSNKYYDLKRQDLNDQQKEIDIIFNRTLDI